MVTSSMKDSNLRHREKAEGVASASFTSSDTDSSSDERDMRPATKEGPVKSTKFNHSYSSPEDATLVNKLFSSKEELTVLHLHKILGFSCLGSFIYRFCHVGGADGNFGPSPQNTLVFILHHWLLNISAFIFHLPPRRINGDGGFRIWPEYRIHSLVFASRSLAFMGLLWYEQYYRTTLSNRVDLAIALMTIVCADLGSYSQRKYRSPSVRGASWSDPLEQYFASEMQLFLTAFCITGYRRYTLHLVAVTIIQMNSFLMTLRRKHVASHTILLTCYTMLLVLGLVTITLDDLIAEKALIGGTYGCLAAILRMNPWWSCPKYLLWIGLGMTWYGIEITQILPVYNDWIWLYAFCILKAISALLGFYKREFKTPPGTPKSDFVANLVVAGHVALYGYFAAVIWWGDFE
jgi:hypothetical protein